MVKNEKELADAIMRGDTIIELNELLVSGVGKIKYPSEVVWKSVVAALISSAFFWGSPCAAMLGFTIGLPAVLAVCGGVGGVVFVTLGAQGTICAFRLLIATKTINVLTNLREKYDMEGNKLIRKIL